MGNVAGTVQRYERDALGMTPPEWELALRLVEAYPGVVPYDGWMALSNGEPATRDYVGSVAFDLRRSLGPSAVETVFRRGYRAGPLLVEVLRDLQGSPRSSEVGGPPAGGSAKGPEERAPHRRTWWPRAWQSLEPHRNDQGRIMAQLEAACREAVGL